MKMRRFSRLLAWMFCLALVLGVASVRPVYAAAQEAPAKKIISDEATAPNGVVPAKEKTRTTSTRTRRQSRSSATCWA
jgi:hypothetical protein